MSELDALLASMGGAGSNRSTSGRGSGNVQSELEGLLSQRIKKAKEEEITPCLHDVNHATGNVCVCSAESYESVSN